MSKAANIYLAEIRRIGKQIRQLNIEIKKLRAMRGNVTQKYDSSPVQSSKEGTGSRDAALTDAIVDYEQELILLKQRFISAKKVARDVIDLMETPKYQVFLLSYYVDCEKEKGKLKSLEEVAEELGYSWRHMNRIKREALREFDEFFLKMS